NLRSPIAFVSLPTSWQSFHTCSSLDTSADSEVIRLEHLSKEGVEHSALVEVFNVPEFTRILICDLKPRLARLLTKSFPAYVILAAFRYHDHAHDETALTGLFSTLHIMLKDTVAVSRQFFLVCSFFMIHVDQNVRQHSTTSLRILLHFFC
ncbi:hypothetical protein GCK32_017238, partial [Trichostrongylus colubriformis]